MAESPDRDQQTEAPTAKRQQDAARDGDVLISRELASALAMLAGVGWLALAGERLVTGARETLRTGLSFDSAAMAGLDLWARLAKLLAPLLMPIAMLFGLGLVAAIAGPALLGSLGWRGKALGFKASRISPLAGMKRMFGAQGLAELGKALAKAALLGGIGCWLVAGALPTLMPLAGAHPAHASAVLGDTLLTALFALTAGMAAIALADVPLQYWQRRRRLRMTREQVREELRQSEGAPELKAALRARQQAILTQSARKAMGEASVVLTNPSHFAVALRYHPGKDAAPVVLARGRGAVALAMRTLAAEKAVPMLEYPALTRALYFTTRAGQTIPEDLFQAVAIILAFVFRLDRELGARQPPTIDVPAAKRFDAEGRREQG